MAAQVPTTEQTVFPEQGPLPQAGGAAFGAQVGAATEGLGQEISQTGDIEFKHVMQWQGLKNEATAQDMDVQFQGDLGNLEDKFYQLKGKAQADAYPQFQSDLTALRQKYLGAAPNPMVNNMLGQSVAYSVARSLRSAGVTAGEATRNWMIDSANSRVESLKYNSAKRFSDQGYADETNAAIDAGAKNLGEMQGWSPEHTALYAEIQKDDLAKQRQANAQAFLKGQPVADVVRSLAGGDTGPQGKVGGQDYRSKVVAVEFGSGQNDPNNPHQGPVQADDDWWKRFGRGGDRNNMNDALAALDLETSVNEPQLKEKLDRNVTDADLYLAHQQGLAGAVALLTHPNAPASQSVPVANIQANLPAGTGDANTITGGEFASIWGRHFAGAGGIMANNPAGQNSQIDAAVATLSPEQRQGMTKDMLTAWRVQSDAAYTDQQHQQAALQKAQKLQLDTADAKIQQLMMTHDRDPSQQGVDMLKVAQSPLYADQPDRVKSLIAFQKALDKPDGEAGASARNTSQMFGKLFPSDGTPPLSQKDLDAAFVSQDPDQHINKSDYDWLTSQVAEAKDPTSKRLNGQANDVFKVVERQIDPSFSGSSGESTHSPFSGTRMLQYKQAVAERIAAFKAAGKDPAVLFDPSPGNKDYVGSPGFTAPYTRSMTDLMQEEMTGQEAAPVAPAAAPAGGEGIVPAANAADVIREITSTTKSYGTMEDLQAAINRHELSLADAQKYALDHKLARAAKPPAPEPQVPIGP